MLREIDVKIFTDINIKIAKVFDEMERVDVKKRIKEIEDERNLSIRNINKELRTMDIEIKIAMVLFILMIIVYIMM